MAEPYRVLFVCTANICRSAYADVVARGSGVTGLAFASAGTHGRQGDPLDPPMAALVRAGDPAAHASRRLTRDIAEGADLILAMGQDHRRFILEEFPELSRRAFLLGQAARHLAQAAPGRPDAVVEHLWSVRDSRPDDEVPDPYGRGDAAAQAAASLIDRHLASILGPLQRAVGAAG